MSTKIDIYGIKNMRMKQKGTSSQHHNYPY